MQHRDQAGGVDVGLVHQQGLQLRVPVLLDHEHLRVGGDEVGDLLLERERAHTQGIDVDVPGGERVQRLGHRRAGGTEIDHAEARRMRRGGEHGLGHQRLRGLEFLQ